MNRLLVTELWGVGDLAIGSNFFHAAQQQYELALLAKPHAAELARNLWPQIEVIPWVAPWTRFVGKYRFYDWPWRELRKTIKTIRGRRFDIAASARSDPRDHVILRLSGAARRLGFAKMTSQLLLTESLPAAPNGRRATQWRTLGQALDLKLPTEPAPKPPVGGRLAIIHTGSAQQVRIWPQKRFCELARHLRRSNWKVTILCDPDQSQELDKLGESYTCPENLSALIDSLRLATVFLGNDSGPGHLAAALGIPTFTVFGPQKPEWFVPDHPQAAYLAGKPCPYKPCFDYCRFPHPHCLHDNTIEEVWDGVQQWLESLDTTDSRSRNESSSTLPTN